MHKTYLFILASIFFSIELEAQLSKDIFPLKQQFKNGGFYIAPHATVSIGNKETGSWTIVDTTYDYEVIGRGKWGYGLEIGWFHSFENPRLIHYIEGGASYRIFKGAAEHEGTLTTPISSTFFKSDNEFDAQMIVASVRAANVRQLGKYSFLSTALGINYNYKIGDSYKRSSEYPIQNEKFIEQSTVQLHLQVGVGFLESEKYLFVPYVETPLLTAYPADNLNPAFPLFSAMYQPIIIGLKVMFLREDPVNCNAPVYKGISH